MKTIKSIYLIIICSMLQMISFSGYATVNEKSPTHVTENYLYDHSREHAIQIASNAINKELLADATPVVSQVSVSDSSGSGKPDPWDGNSIPISWDAIVICFATIGSFVALIMVVTGWILRIGPPELLSSTGKQVLSFIVSIGLGYVATKLHLPGVFTALQFTTMGWTWAYSAFVCVMGACIANSYFDSKTFDNMLVLIGSLPGKVRDARKKAN